MQEAALSLLAHLSVASSVNTCAGKDAHDALCAREGEAAGKQRWAAAVRAFGKLVDEVPS